MTTSPAPNAKPAPHDCPAMSAYLYSVEYTSRVVRLQDRLMDMRYGTLNALATRCGFNPECYRGHRMDLVAALASYIVDLHGEDA